MNFDLQNNLSMKCSNRHATVEPRGFIVLTNGTKSLYSNSPDCFGLYDLYKNTSYKE